MWTIRFHLPLHFMLAGLPSAVLTSGSLPFLRKTQNRPLWKIIAKTTVDRREAGSMVIQYGRLPERFGQEIPASGEPPPLKAGKRYVAVAGGTSYVPWARVRFIVKDNKIVSLPSQQGDLP